MQDQSRLAGMPAAAALLLIALSVSADEAIWFSGPAFCEGICVSSPPGAEPVPLNRSILPSITNDNIGSFDLSPDGQSIAFIRVDRPVGYNDVWVMDSDGNNPRELAAQPREYCEHRGRGKVCSMNTPSFGRGIQWSPDGSEILYFLSQRFRLLHESGTEILYMDTIAGIDNLSHYHWSSMGIVFPAYNRMGETFIAIADRSGNIIKKFDIFEGDFWGFNPALSPDESKLSFSLYGNLYIYDIANEILRTIETGEYHYVSHAWSPDGQRIVCYYGDSEQIKVVDVEGTRETVLLETSYVTDIEWMSGASTGISPASWGKVKRQHVTP